MIRVDPERNAREKMVREQIGRRGISDFRVLGAMRKVPRHLFVAEEFRSEAYEDGPLSIGQGQTISQPYIVAYMTECLKVAPTDRVLEIGTGCGYQTAVLAELAKEVFTVEILEPLAKLAEVRLQSLNYRNIRFRIANGRRGWPEEAPFEKIIVTAVALEIPEALTQQLQENSRIIIPVGYENQELIEGEKSHGILKKTRKIPVRFVPLIDS